MDLKINVLLREDESVEKRIIQKKFLKAPVKMGQVAGTVYYMLDGKIIAEKDIIIMSSVDVINLKGVMCWLLNVFLCNNTTHSVKFS